MFYIRDLQMIEFNRTKLQILQFLLPKSIVLFLLIWSYSAPFSAEDLVPTLVNTIYPELPTSFDPLNSHQTNPNFITMNTLYAKPIEFDPLGRYGSSILDRFVYLDQNHTLKFFLKTNVFFGDGTPITLDDLAFNIARVIRSFPKLNHHEEILGVKEWMHLKSPLLSYPSGFSLDPKLNCLSIQYKRSQLNPFFSFAQPLYGIIPKSSVDPFSGKLRVSIPPFSGPYSLAHLDPDGYRLERRESVAPSSFPKKIWVRNVDPFQLGSILKQAHKYYVFMVDKASLQEPDQKYLDQEFRSPPAIEIAIDGAVFNTRNPLFASKRMRQFFAEELRKSVFELGFVPSGSFFTLIQPGYLSLKDLRTSIPSFSMQEKDRFLSQLKQHPPIVGLGHSGTFFQQVFEHTIKRLGIQKRAVNHLTKLELDKMFASGKIDILNSQIFLAGLEPLNTPKYLISTGMIPTYTFLNQNPEIHHAVSQFYQKDPFTVDLKGAERLSRLLFEDASFSIYRSYGRESFVRKESPLNFTTQFLSLNIIQYFNEKKGL